MSETQSWKTSFETKPISRHELKCYVDSWTGPLSGERPDAPAKWCVYAFGAPDSHLVKIGSTRRPVARTTSGYAPPDSVRGHFIVLEPCAFEHVARTAELTCHRILAPWRIPSRSRVVNRNEWYDVDPLVATRAAKFSAQMCEWGLPALDFNHVRDLITNL